MLLTVNTGIASSIMKAALFVIECIMPATAEASLVNLHEDSLQLKFMQLYTACVPGRLLGCSDFLIWCSAVTAVCSEALHQSSASRDDLLHATSH